MNDRRYVLAGPEVDPVDATDDNSWIAIDDLLPQIGEDADEVRARVESLAVGREVAFGRLLVVRVA